MTIFKLVDRDTGEESVEYAQGMVFQRPCDRCQHLKVCVMESVKSYVGSSTSYKMKPHPVVRMKRVTTEFYLYCKL